MAITPRSLFNIILKIFGLFFLREVINQLPRIFSTFVSYFSVTELQSSLTMLFVSVAVLCFYVVLALQLLFRTNHWVDVLKLDKGFDEQEFSFEERKENRISLSVTDVLRIALIVLGGYILVDEVPEFCKLVYSFSEDRRTKYGGQYAEVSDLLACIAKILIALVLLGERNKVIAFIEQKTPGKRDEGI